MPKLNTSKPRIICGAVVRYNRQRRRCTNEATKFYFDGVHYRARCDKHSKDNFYERCPQMSREEFIVRGVMDS